MVTTHERSRSTRRTYTATTRMEDSVKLMFPVLAPYASGWHEILPDCVCVSLEAKNYDRAQELVGSLPAFNGVAANSPLGETTCQTTNKTLDYTCIEYTIFPH